MENLIKLVIGIAGGSGSGKTTIVNNIVESFPPDSVAILNQDNYYVDLSHLSIADRKKFNFDHPDAFDMTLFKQHLELLKNGHSIECPVYDFLTYTRKNLTKTIHPAKVLIVEGILIFSYPELRSLYTIKVFIDTDGDIRLMRRIRRDIFERKRSLDSVLSQYENTVRPMYIEFVEPTKRFADIIIPEGGFNIIAVELLIERIKKELNT